jgi:ribonuclease E
VGDAVAAPEVNVNESAADGSRGEGRGRRRRRGRRGGARNREGGQASTSSEGHDGDYGSAREASAEEREFHAQQSNGNRAETHEHGAPSEAPRESAAERGEPRQRNEGTQAPLDLPPPPQAKPFVVWSSSPSADTTETRRDE